MGFLTIFYKYMIQQYFTITAPHSVFSQYLKQIKYQMLVQFYIKYRLIQQYFTITAPHSVFSQYLKQIKYQMLIVVHIQSDENVRLQWGF